jgi:hypothetical protein
VDVEIDRIFDIRRLDHVAFTYFHRSQAGFVERASKRITPLPFDTKNAKKKPPKGNILDCE